jgi:hypothetical protein
MAFTWYLKQGQRELGPLSVGQLKWLAQRGRLTRSDRVRADDSDRWQRLVDVPELALICDSLASREAAASSQATRRKDRRWRDVDEEDSNIRSTRLNRPAPPMKAPPRQQTAAAFDHRSHPPARPEDDAYARHRLAKWRAKRAHAGTFWSLVCLILVGLISAGGGAWMMSRVIRDMITDQTSKDTVTDEITGTSPQPADDEGAARQQQGEPFRVPAGLERRLKKVASWNGVGQSVRTASGRTRLEVTQVWTEPGMTSEKSTSSKVLFQLRLTNLDHRVSRQYHSWNLRIPDGTILLDEFDRLCPMISLSEDRRAERKSRAPWPPSSSITDVLVFCVPDGYGDQLRLVLPLAATGDAGYAGFTIHRDQIQKRPPMQIDRLSPTPSPLLRSDRDSQGSARRIDE